MTLPGPGTGLRAASEADAEDLKLAWATGRAQPEATASGRSRSMT